MFVHILQIFIYLFIRSKFNVKAEPILTDFADDVFGRMYRTTNLSIVRVDTREIKYVHFIKLNDQSSDKMTEA